MFYLSSVGSNVLITLEEMGICKNPELISWGKYNYTLLCCAMAYVYVCLSMNTCIGYGHFRLLRCWGYLIVYNVLDINSIVFQYG